MKTGTEPRSAGAEGSAQGNAATPTLTALRIHTAPEMPIVPGTQVRPWMEATHHRFAYRCLPLMIANESGWMVLSSHTVLVTWDGGQALDSIRIEYLNGDATRPAVSHFGHGILTWTLPYLFRTSPGYNLLLRGPANWPNDGAHPLEGVVETDWSLATATMNWKLTRPGLTVRFDVGEPICMLVPQRRGELESFQTAEQPLSERPDDLAGFQEWAHSRAKFTQELHQSLDVNGNQGWQKHYFHGTSPDGRRAAEHQRRLRLAPFREAEGTETRP